MRPSLFALTNDHSVSRTMINAFDANDFTALGTIGSQQRPSIAVRSAPMAVEQQLQLMNTINTMVKNSQFTNQLANSIFTLCFQLKNSGFMLEQSHKNELNKVFISLRQACCRDNGQLGTPCRLKIMELVELRAMHWRSTLAHSQYYVNRPEQQHDPTPMSATTQGIPFIQQAPLFMQQQDIAANTAPNSGFYLIPAAGNWMPPILPGGIVPPNTFLPQPIISPEPVLMRQRSIKKINPVKTLQLRHEMIIRNSDSGKIMGVKGRRVALVEQITNTVISFQKVDPKSKERTLTITASTMEDIERAKELIIDTIRRNMSPIRPESSTTFDSLDDDDNDISIETTQDGMLKLCCSDPQILQAAQEALSEYLRVRAKPSAEEREKRKERRKSMPLQLSHQEPCLKSSHSFHGSTPNLAEVEVDLKLQSLSSCHTGNRSVARYDRAALMGLRTDASLPYGLNVRQAVATIAPEILR